jgi:hypothetical protein
MNRHRNPPPASRPPRRQSRPNPTREVELAYEGGKSIVDDYVRDVHTLRRVRGMAVLPIPDALSRLDL